MKSVVTAALLAGFLLVPSFAFAQSGTTTHALTLGDAPKYGADFKHLDYVNPEAPKGGTVRYAVLGSYDSFNRRGSAGYMKR